MAFNPSATTANILFWKGCDVDVTNWIDFSVTDLLEMVNYISDHLS